jgi:acetate kinase
MRILVLNCGSSSVKFRLFEMENEDLMAAGLVERIGSRDAGFLYRVPGRDDHRVKVEAADHSQAIDLILKTLSDPEGGVVSDIHDIHAIGHRVVHGAETFTEPALIDEAVLSKIKECIRFAPLHNPPNISGIEASLYLIPFARQVAVFDTSFHQTMKPDAFIYALPYEWYEKRGIRRYGFHGTSHRYVSSRASEILGRPLDKLKIITCHLGNGASIAAVDRGRAVDTSMGFTPVEGLVMGTRCGDIDPAIPLHIMEEDGLSAADADTILNKKSGLCGITGGDNDLRTIEEKAGRGSRRHELALTIFARRVKKYIGAYSALMGGLDCVVFTAGIGENSPTVRRMVCEGLEFLGIEVDDERNQAGASEIGKGDTALLVIPTDEELAIAQEVRALLAGEKQPEVPPPVEGTGRPGKRILIIDDDPDIRAAVNAILDSAGYDCFEAGTMKEGVGKVSGVRPDLILLDVMMEDISAGFRFARELRLAERKDPGRRTPIVMLTGVERLTNLKFQHRVGTDELPVDVFLEKPVEPGILLAKVRELLPD